MCFPEKLLNVIMNFLSLLIGRIFAIDGSWCSGLLPNVKLYLVVRYRMCLDGFDNFYSCIFRIGLLVLKNS